MDIEEKKEEGQTGIIEPVEIDHEMRTAYIDYSMSVIVSRALPDVRDGLKPVQRRVLFGMDGLGLSYSGPTRKCAKIVGEVLGLSFEPEDIHIMRLNETEEEFDARIEEYVEVDEVEDGLINAIEEERNEENL